MTDAARAEDVVRGVYERLSANDLLGLLNACAADVEWRLGGRAAHGREGVAEWWMAADEEREVVACTPADVRASGGRVLARGTLRGRVRATGRFRSSEWVHEWVVRDGLVASAREADDRSAQAERR